MVRVGGFISSLVTMRMHLEAIVSPAMTEEEVEPPGRGRPMTRTDATKRLHLQRR